MAGNNVVWQPQVVNEMLRYYKEKIQSEGKQFVFKETHHEECAKQNNAKFTTSFTQRQVYHKFHKLKGQWKIDLDLLKLVHTVVTEAASPSLLSSASLPAR